MTITRREWTALLGALPLFGQTPVQAPVPAAPPEGIEKATADVRDVSQRLAEIEMPLNIEPAFRFVA